MNKKLRNIAITILLGAFLYYFLLPPMNLSSFDFWFFIITLLIIYIVLSSMKNVQIVNNNFVMTKAPTDIKVIFIIIVAIIGMISVTNIIMSPVFIPKAYSQRIIVDESSTFNENVNEVDFNALPIIDKASSQRLGDRVMGQIPDLVSQFNVSNLYTQINYNNDIVRVTPLEYSDIFKYFGNRDKGVAGYIIVNSVTGEASLTRLDKGMRFMNSAILNEKLDRILRFSYPTKIFGEKTFEIDNEGNPYWIVPTIKYHGFNIRAEINGVIILDPITGKSKLYDIEEVPTWVDHSYSADLILEQVNDWGKYRNGFLNSIFGQKNVVTTTEGYNYTVMNDDVYLYTGITSAVADESNIGFILTNMRTKKTNFYAVAGAEEYSAMASAEGQVQQMNYRATFPLLINLNDKPTYFVSLKDHAGLVKMYAFVDIADYQKVVVTDASKGIIEAAQNYIGDKSINIDDKNITYKEITVASITSSTINGNSYYYITDTSNKKYRIVISVNDKQIPFIKVDDNIKIGYLTEEQVTDIIKLEI